jgi:ribonuclease BN (tRNA processing enzyme)
VSQLRLQFLGSGDAFGGGGRFQTCMHLDDGTTHALIDCGASSLIAMRRFGLDPDLVDLICVSHLHGDHFGGLPFLALDLQFNSERTPPLRVAGPPGIGQRVREAMEVLFPGSSKIRRKYELEFIELEPERPAQLGSFEVTPFAVVHASGATPFALRVRSGDKVIAYSGDTEWTDALVEAARGADLFVCEASSFDSTIPFHLSWATLRAHVNELNCARLMLTHMSAEMIERLPQLEVEAADDGLTLEL